METFHVFFERTLSAKNSKQNIPFTFQIPAGTTWVQIWLSFTPDIVDGIHNLLTLTVFDPSGWLGEGHRSGSRQEVVLGEYRPSPGYLTRPVQAGKWMVVLNIHMVMPGPTCQVVLDVSGGDQPAKGAGRAFEPGHTASRGPGWYRGDLHAHTVHSDARWQVADLVAYARARQLDFATLSDHNTIAGLAEMDAARSDDLLTIGGMELTTFWGHALVLGLREWIDWRVTPGGQTMERIAAQAYQRGALFIIAHPKSVGDPFCTGCDWLYPELMPGGAGVVEVWNDDWLSDSNNEDGLKLAYAWLNQGYRLALTAGSDNHGGRLEQSVFGFNIVYAEDLSEVEILRAIRAGHLYLSSGPVLVLEASSGAKQIEMGDVLKIGANDPIQLNVRWEACPADAQLDLILDGVSQGRWQAPGSGSRTWLLTGSQAHWGLVTVRDAQGKMLALTNPIYWDGRNLKD